MSVIESSYIDRISNKKNRKVFFSRTGTGMVPVYEYKIIDGIKNLVRVSERNLQEEIDSFALSTDIHVLIERVINGDDSVLRPNGVFGDFTNAPKTYAEMFEGVQKCKNIFYSLPADIRDKFDNSYEKFWADYGSDHFNSVFNEFTVNDSSVSDDVSEVNNNAE